MANNIVLLSGSPRKNGNTDRLVAAFVEGANAAGKKARVFRVADMKIAPCLSCNACFKHPGVCAQKDDMADILAAVSKADAIVFASPIYFFAVSAQLKAAIDRLYAMTKAGMPIRESALLLTCGAPTTRVVESVIFMFRAIGSYQKWREAGIVVAPNLHEPGEIDGRPELSEARKLGETI
ncbi:MAG: flavodoxin family protein [Desulfobulbaceae bacterium]|jgi:NAD(P)H-dependent FMN reductase|nr:flavodoxin family protein [Desulfobulbaceae bacterium]